MGNFYFLLYFFCTSWMFYNKQVCLPGPDEAGVWVGPSLSWLYRSKVKCCLYFRLGYFGGFLHYFLNRLHFLESF